MNPDALTKTVTSNPTYALPPFCLLAPLLHQPAHPGSEETVPRELTVQIVEILGLIQLVQLLLVSSHHHNEAV
jgi:hypothetical protein